jgi:predicted secreted Zn-dependent protease
MDDTVMFTSLPHSCLKRSRCVAELLRTLTIAVHCLLFLLISRQLSAADSLNIRTNYYDVTGDTFQTIREEIVRRRPWKEESDAFTHCKVDWTFTMEDPGSGCRLKSLSIRTDITITMPRWNVAASEDEGLKAAWISYFKVLAAHEEGHKQIALAAAKEARKRILQIKPTGSCSELESSINREGKKVIEQFAEREKVYDARTDHGRKQANPSQ